MAVSSAFTPKQNYDLVKRTKQENYLFLNENYAKHGQTVLFGDSITEIFNSYELFHNFSQKSGQAVYNRGISGDTSDRLLWRLQSNALNIAPRNLVILIGTNDLGLGIPASELVGNVREILRITKERLPNTNIVLQGIYPVNKHMSLAAAKMVGRRKNKDISAVNEQLRALAADSGVIYLDLSDKLSDKRGRLAKEFCYDGLHLNVHGFAVAAQAIIPCLK